HEHVRATAVLRDEAEAFLTVEELHGTSRHSHLLETLKSRCYPRKPFARASIRILRCLGMSPVTGRLRGRRNLECRVYSELPRDMQTESPPCKSFCSTCCRLTAISMSSRPGGICRFPCRAVISTRRLRRAPTSSILPCGRRWTGLVATASGCSS